jgi:NAD(P)-dependent dehydrogenase (short-subunit alcohol dehydrogenase family)
MSLKDKQIVVIGGSSGIGLAVARGGAAQGAKVLIAGRDAHKLDAAAHAIPGITTEVLDVRDEEQVADYFERIGTLDHLVVTAGTLIGASPLVTQDFAALRDAVDSKLYGSLLAAKHAAPRLRPGGSIGLTSGVLARKPTANALVKTLINAALEAAVRQMAKELAPLRVYAVSPGPVNTPSWAYLDDTARAAVFDKLNGTLPVGFAASPDDTAAAYLFAMQARALTGTVIDLDSGASIAG